MVIDPTTNIGKMRLRLGDYTDLPIFGDEVYQSALDDCNGNLPQACKLVAQYILATLTGQTHQKLAQVEVYGREWFISYKEYIKLTILNPNFMQAIPPPFGVTEPLPLADFQSDWNLLYGVTEAQQNHALATAVCPYF